MPKHAFSKINILFSLGLAVKFAVWYHSICVRNETWYGPMVKRFKTPPSQGGITSSILVRVTTNEDCSLREWSFFFERDRLSLAPANQHSPLKPQPVASIHYVNFSDLPFLGSRRKKRTVPMSFLEALERFP